MTVICARKLALLTQLQISFIIRSDMKRDKAKQKAVAAIRTIVEAAKELAEAEAVYNDLEKKPRKKTKCAS